MPRHDYGREPDLGDRVFELLEATFPGVGIGRRNGAAFGALWESISTPFIVEDGPRVVAHVGLLPLPLHLMGERLVVGAVHGVATDSEFRRRGHFRDLMEELPTLGEMRVFVRSVELGGFSAAARDLDLTPSACISWRRHCRAFWSASPTLNSISP